MHESIATRPFYEIMTDRPFGQHIDRPTDDQQTDMSVNREAMLPSSPRDNAVGVPSHVTEHSEGGWEWGRIGLW